MGTSRLMWVQVVRLAAHPQMHTQVSVEGSRALLQEGVLTEGHPDAREHRGGKMRQLAKSLQWDLSYYIESKQIRTPANYSLEKTKSNVHDSLEQHLHSHACKHCMLISVRLYHIYTGG